MHIPDGFLSPRVWATLDLASVPAIGYMARCAQRDLGLSDSGLSGGSFSGNGAGDHRQIPLMGVMGAFVFAAQMINFPVGLGTSGHLVGGTLLAITLGPAAASLVMTAILAIQAFVFQDGGVTALGANILNMAVVGVLAGYLPYRLLARHGGKWRSAAIFLGGIVSVLASACLALAQLLISGVPMPGRLLAVSLVLFTVSAILEGAITVAAVRAIERLNPVWIRSPRHSGSRTMGVVAIAAVLLAVAGILIASAAPDGIQKLAAQTGLAAGAPAWLHAPLADYQFHGFDAIGLSSMWLRKAAAGLAGLLLIYVLIHALSVLLGRAVSRRAVMAGSPVKEGSA
jgi:cobalt/nickel transport system permease protein